MESKVITEKSDEDNVLVAEAKTMRQIIFSQFMEHRFAVIGASIILLFLAAALFAPVISSLTGLDPNVQNMFHRYKPPFTRAPYSQDMIETKFKRFEQSQPGVTAAISQELQNTLNLDRSEIEFDLEKEEFLLSLHDLMQSDADFRQSLEDLAGPATLKFMKVARNMTTLHLCGTDELGRDALIRMIYGARVSIGVGLLVAFSAAIIGLFIGSLAGFYGGVVDQFLMRVTDSMLSLPILPVLIVCAAVDLKKLPGLQSLLDTNGETLFKVVFILSSFSWMTVARLVRGSILSLKEQDFIHAARTLGAKSFFIIRVHLVPNVLAPLLVAVTVNVGVSILLEAYLSFLGLGIQPPTPSWGNMLRNAIELIYEAPHLAIFPGFLIFVTVISFNFVGDGLQDAVDPKAIRR